MTGKSTKTAKGTSETNVGVADATATTDGNKAGTGGAKAKPAKSPTTTRKPRQRPAVADDKANAERKARTDTKQAKLIAMLEAKDGATVAEIAAAFGWQAHTVRGALYGALKQRLGLDVTSEKVEGKGRVYRIGS